MTTKSYIEKMCFVLMPFSKNFKNQWELAFKPAIKDAGLRPWRGDEKTLGTNIIMRDVTRSISEAELIIADLTGKNPNVMYELGLAHAAKKPVIMLIQNEEDVPFDIMHIRYLKYDHRDLSDLRIKLFDRIKTTIAMGPANQPDFFPELRIFLEKDLQELKYLREKVINIEITASPPIADLFFNDKYIGHAPQMIKVNPDAVCNTISAAFPEYFEFHRELSEKDYSTRKISIILEQRKMDELSKQVPRWLRDRRLYPDNPVLMLAIYIYLREMKEYEEAKAELDNLLSVAPEWYLYHNSFGVWLLRTNKLEESVKHFQTVVSLKPDHYIGYFNLACAASLRNKYDSCISYLKQILDSKDRCRSYSCKPYNTIAEDPDFDSIKSDPEYAEKFNAIVEEFTNMYEKLSGSCNYLD